MRLFAKAEYDIMGRGYRIWILRESSEHAEVLGADGSWSPMPEGYERPQPTFRFSKELAVALLEGLVAEGLELPSRPVPGDDAKLAQKAHLEDMRALTHQLVDHLVRKKP